MYPKIGQKKNKNDFFNQVAEGIREKLGDQYEIELDKVLKVNLTLNGLRIRKKDSNVAPTIYLNQFHHQFIGGRSMDSILDEILSIHEKELPTTDIPVNKYLDFDTIKDKIIIKVIGTERNRAFLNETPHKLIGNLGLAATLYVVLQFKGEFSMGFYIKEEHLRIWNKSVNDLLSIATENMNRQYSFTIRKMDEIMAEMLGDDNFCSEVNSALSTPLYVLREETSKSLGATALFLEEQIKAFAKEQDSDVFIFPSSIHELILSPSRYMQMNILYMKEMVQEINETQVAASDFLSDGVFYYDRFLDMFMRL